MFDEKYPNGYGIFIAPMFACLINKLELSKKQIKWIFILGLSMCLIQYVFILLISIHRGTFYMNALHYQYPASIIIPISVFVCFKYINWDILISRLHVSKLLITKLCSCSFGIYLIHNFIQIIFGWFCNHIIDLHLNNGYCGYIFVYITSLFTIIVMKKIPGLRMLVP